MNPGISINSASPVDGTLTARHLGVPESAKKALLGQDFALVDSIRKSMKRIDAFNEIWGNQRILRDSLGFSRLYDAQKSISNSFTHLKFPMWESWRNESTRFKDMFGSMSKLAEQAKLINHFSGFVPALHIPNFTGPDFSFLSDQAKLGFLDSFNEKLSISKMLGDRFIDIASLRDKKYREILDSISGDTKNTLSTSAYADLLEELNSRMPAEALKKVQTAPVNPELVKHTDQEVQSYRKELSSKLSAIPTSVLLLWLSVMLHFFSVIASWDDMRQSLVDINSRIPQTESLKSTRELIRKELAGKPGDVRIVKGKNVFLREKPSMKSEGIIPLRKYAPVLVIHKVDRNWFLVSYEHEGYTIDGYVSTKFLRDVK
ncbi:SH3 domain-containing protein [Oxalobacteraceae bacterium CAVE-383]|nr:SH3 domain-containing protein [Oxalobacteraceae bacterium CAVE-383]